MSEIDLQDLIYQVKKDLLMPNPKETRQDPYPLFIVDKIELEISVNITKSNAGGVKLTVLNLADVSGSKTHETSQGHVVKVSLSPILSHEALLHMALQDPLKRDQILKRSEQAFVKGSDFRE